MTAVSARHRRPQGFAVLAAIMALFSFSLATRLIARRAPSTPFEAVSTLSSLVLLLLACVTVEALWRCRSTALAAMTAFTVAVMANFALRVWVEGVNESSLSFYGFVTAIYVGLPFAYVYRRSVAIFGRRGQRQP